MRNQKYLLFVASMFALPMSAGSAFAQCCDTATGTGALPHRIVTISGVTASSGVAQFNQSRGVNTAVGAEALQSNKTGVEAGAVATADNSAVVDPVH